MSLFHLAFALRCTRAGHSLARWGALSLALLLVFWRAPLASAQPAATTLNTVSAYYNGTVILGWNQSYASGFSSYKIYRSTSAGVTDASTLVQTITSSGATSFNDSSAKATPAPGTTFYYRIAVVAASGATLSNEKSITLIDAPPAAVTINNLSAGYTGSGANLSWSQNYDYDFASYKIYRGTTAGVTPDNGTLVTTITSNNNTSYSDNAAIYSIPPGTTYYYIVCVVDAAGQVTPSPEKNITLVNKPPVAVTINNLSAGYTGSGANLSWSQNYDYDFASYTIYRGLATGVTPQNGTLVTTITSNGNTSYSDNTAIYSVPPGTTYYYIVCVTDVAGQVTPSAEKSITLINKPPVAVTINNLSAGYTGSGANLSWSQNYDYDFASYKIYRGTAAGVTPDNGTLVTMITSNGTTSYSDSAAVYSVSPGTTYYYTVAVTDAAGQVTLSAEKSITLINKPPVTVTIQNLSAGYTGSGANLSWSQNYDYDFASYKIYRGTTPGVTPANGTLLTTINSNSTTSYSDAGAVYSVAPGTTYYYIVCVTDAAGQVTPSAEKSVTLLNKPPVAVTINNLSASYTGNGANLSWSQNYDYDFASYKVYRGTTAGVTPDNGTLVTTITSNSTTSYSDNAATYSIPPGTTYYYIVCVTDVAGQVTLSAEKNITLVNKPPVAVTIQNISAGYTGNGVNLSWNQSYEYDFASYKIYRGTAPGVTSANGTLLTTITSSGTTYYSDATATSTAPPGTTYYYIVVVTDVATQATPSPEKSIVLVNNPPSAVTLTLSAGTYPDYPGVNLSWNQSYEYDFASYKVYRSTTAGATPQTATLLSTITTSGTTYYRDAAVTYGPPPGTTYYYFVSVIDSLAQETPSAEKSVVLLDAPPTAVVLATPASKRAGVGLSWSQNVDNDFSSYKVYRSTTPGITPQNGTLLTTITLAATNNYTDTSAPFLPPPGVTLYYRVFVVDRGGQLTGSNEVSVQRVDTPYNGTIVYGNNASFGTVTIEGFNLDTGELFDQFVVPNAEASADNGRGIAVVGDTIYYTTANSGKVYKMNKITHADGGVAFDTHLPGIACLSWDGTTLWLIPYNGANDAYRYTPTGTLIQIVNGFGNSRDGFEIANSYIVCNRGDATGPYDLYSLDGTLVQASFINPNFSPTGITFDGSKFIVSKIFGDSGSEGSGTGSQLAIYNMDGTLDHIVHLDGPYPHGQRLLEDLSALGNIPSNTLAEPGTR